MKKENIFLLVASLGIFPVALTYGLFQELFFGIDVNSIEMTNIFRATMGLYVAMGTFWLVAAFNNKYTFSALHSLIVFMSGLAAARMVSMLVDGTPNIVLVGYTVIEAVIAFSGYAVLKGSTNANFQQQNKVGAY
ncbi:Membrane protein [Vibrio jasicida]|uniref:Membrane protein n=1 Tax=Vibrio jasicida TaxID=766224 RepID=A0AAU9QTA8_9VIBR|nr:Membrane protein [Vibrio jasicida]CAH1598133.1 Membrane protein [Vibrio jasicida]